MQHAGITVIMVSNIHSCHSTETMPWLVTLTDQSTSLLSPCAVLKSSCSQWTLRHEKAVDVATMSISQSERRSDPQSILLRGPKREVFALSATYPLIEVPLKMNRSIWHHLLEKNRPKAKAKDTVSSFPKTGKQHLTLWPATHLPRSNHQLLWAAIMHTPHNGPHCNWRLQIKWHPPSSIFAMGLLCFFLVKFVAADVDSFGQPSEIKAWAAVFAWSTFEGDKSRTIDGIFVAVFPTPNIVTTKSNLAVEALVRLLGKTSQRGGIRLLWALPEWEIRTLKHRCKESHSLESDLYVRFQSKSPPPPPPCVRARIVTKKLYCYNNNNNFFFFFFVLLGNPTGLSWPNNRDSEIFLQLLPESVQRRSWSNRCWKRVPKKSASEEWRNSARASCCTGDAEWKG